ncbi:PASTA domain-containing protein [Nonomuraea sp. SMC257]|uniref:PASTA domain-containing protein n=1 Tax=Nonomuraea montanisoli TaxID=2741721 RepID=A0A7Y6IH40_9ACTN|nr:PASTA domain-containing protein [Nonomuraea montanisoli]NUW38037.1 PASTA domain-containing protein [Nonomuraea montanisoli]
MNVEDLLAEAMERQVSHVQAPPTLGRTVRSRHRAHVIRFRVAGAALVTAAVAVAVPVALGTGRTAPAPAASSPTSGQDTAVVDSVTMPDVTGMKTADAVAAVRAAGLGLEGPEPSGTADEIVVTQKPAAGTELARNSLVVLRSMPRAKDPQDLGDLGDGRTFGGIHIGYLPEGLAWDRWSGKNGFGRKSYATSFSPGGDGTKGYGVEVVVYEGEAVRHVRSRMGTVPSVEIGERRGYLGNLTDGGEVIEEPREDTTATIGFLLRDDLAVEVYISPMYVKKVDAPAELKKIAEGIEAAE